MANAPKRPCNEFGCGALVERGQSYCPAHKRERWKANSAARDETTDPNAGFYRSSRWRKRSLAQRRLEPMCRRCRDAGRVTIGSLADHIVPIADGGERWASSNLQTLCGPCHARKTAEDKAHLA